MMALAITGNETLDIVIGIALVIALVAIGLFYIKRA